MEKILISSCLLGQKLRYNGSSLAVESPLIDIWREEGRLIGCCPEIEGGMKVPRPAAEIINGDGAEVLAGRSEVSDIMGQNVTAPFLRGARAALSLCRKEKIRIAVLAEGSPSCGSSFIYDGTFRGIRKAGNGVTSALLRDNGIQVFSQHHLKEAEQALND